jgi:ABC-type multidrug transport system fused ATPase/permease subunit
MLGLLTPVVLLPAPLRPISPTISPLFNSKFISLITGRFPYLELNKGEIVGLIGLNGAGKSTTIKHMLGLLTPMEGSLSISDININDDIEAYL